MLWGRAEQAAAEVAHMLAAAKESAQTASDVLLAYQAEAVRATDAMAAALREVAPVGLPSLAAAVTLAAVAAVVRTTTAERRSVIIDSLPPDQQQATRSALGQFDDCNSLMHRKYTEVEATFRDHEEREEAAARLAAEGTAAAVSAADGKGGQPFLTVMVVGERRRCRGREARRPDAGS